MSCMHMHKIIIYVILLLCYYTHYLMDWLAKTLQRNLGFKACKPTLTIYMMLKNGLIISMKHHNLETRNHPVQSTRLWVWGKPAHTSWPWVRSACKFRTCHLSGPHKATPSPVHRRLPQITPWGETRTFHCLCVSFWSLLGHVVYCFPRASPLHVSAQHPPSSFTSTVFQPCNATDISQTSVLPWGRSTSRDLEPWTSSGEAIKVLLPGGSYWHESFSKVLYLKCLQEYFATVQFLLAVWIYLSNVKRRIFQQDKYCDFSQQVAEERLEKGEVVS